MKVVVDKARCEGHGFCESVAPAVFELDDEGELIHHYDGRDLPAELEAEATEAVISCPVVALRLER